jgi:hypothetical protein
MSLTREEYLKLSDLCPNLDGNKVETVEVVLFFCDFIETKILPFNTYVNWDENTRDKEKILHIIKVTRMYSEKTVTFEKLKECKNLVKNSDECKGDTNLFSIYIMTWPFTFDFLNDDEIESTEWFENMNCNIPHISINLWYEFVDMVKDRFSGRFLE